MTLKLTLAGALLAVGFATPSFAAPALPMAHGFPQPAAFHQMAKPAPQPARPAKWELVGQRTVSQRLERDTIPVVGRDRHQQIMLCVYNTPVRLQDFDVRFANGGKQDVAVRNVIGAGQCTRAIDLKGQKRDIKSITLAYKAMGFFKRGALVKIFAR
jgi:hypothetical protein